MTALALPMPALSEADPVIAGEGSLDPLGLAQVADRLADHLLPGIRARMRRVRFVTASAVGALASEDLFDVPPKDCVSSPSICFEWLVLEAFARKPEQGAPLDSSGVPGSAKVRSVVLKDQRLHARNYLKSPNVFGFTGVYLPLARHLEVLDDARMPAARITELTQAWETDQGLHGFTDATPRSEGGQFRSRLRGQVLEALRAGHCAEAERGHLWKRICTHLHPLRPGTSERALLQTWLINGNETPVRGWLAPRLVQLADDDERTLMAALSSLNPPTDVRLRLDAIAAYEHVSSLLDGAFRQLRHRSTCLGTAPVTPEACRDDSVLATTAKQMPAALRAACDKAERIDGELALLIGERLSRFEHAMAVPQLVETLMAHHEFVQASKAPKGKRPWFDRYGAGWVVRSLYWHPDEVGPPGDWFVHPYRLSSLQTFMKDLAS